MKERVSSFGPILGISLIKRVDSWMFWVVGSVCACVRVRKCGVYVCMCMCVYEREREWVNTLIMNFLAEGWERGE